VYNRILNGTDSARPAPVTCPSASSASTRRPDEFHRSTTSKLVQSPCRVCTRVENRCAREAVNRFISSVLDGNTEAEPVVSRRRQANGAALCRQRITAWSLLVVCWFPQSRDI
jgi:hypothetical protein